MRNGIVTDSRKESVVLFVSLEKTSLILTKKVENRDNTVMCQPTTNNIGRSPRALESAPRVSTGLWVIRKPSNYRQTEYIFSMAMKRYLIFKTYKNKNYI